MRITDRHGVAEWMEWIAILWKMVVWIGGIAAFLLFSGFLYQIVSVMLDRRAPPGELVSVSGRHMHLLCKGPEMPITVVLEAGGSNSSITSRHLQSEISKFARVCVYDRAGFGFSDPVNRGRTFDEITNDLDQLLNQAGVNPPYILVGESMGGLMVRNYYRHHPDKVAGVLLLDAAEEQHTYELLKKLKEMQSVARTTAWLARFGIVRLLLNMAPEKVGIPPTLSTDRRKDILSEYSRPDFFEAAVLELEAFFSTPPARREAGGFGNLGSTPLIVVKHGKPLTGSQEFLELGWSASQERLAALSTNSKLIVAEDSGHAISLDQPDLVVGLVRELIEKISARE